MALNLEREKITNTAWNIEKEKERYRTNLRERETTLGNYGDFPLYFCCVEF